MIASYVSFLSIFCFLQVSKTFDLIMGKKKPKITHMLSGKCGTYLWYATPQKPEA